MIVDVNKEGVSEKLLNFTGAPDARKQKPSAVQPRKDQANFIEMYRGTDLLFRM